MLKYHYYLFFVLFVYSSIDAYTQVEKIIIKTSSVDSNFIKISSAIKSVESDSDRREIIWINYSKDSDEYIFQKNIKSYDVLNEEIKKFLYSRYQEGFNDVTFSIDTFYQLNKNLIIKSRTKKGIKHNLRSVKFYSDDKKLNLPFIYKVAFRDKLESKRLSLDEMKERINSISFVEIINEPIIKSSDSTYDVYVHLRERKNNQFTAILGVLSSAYGSNTVTLTGDAIIKFNNLFQRGISFDLNWQKTITSSQFLFLKGTYPYLFNTPFGLGTKFSLESIDSQYLRIMFDLNLEYSLDWDQAILMTYRRQSSTISNIDKSEILNGRLPKSLDYSINQIGIGYRWKRLDKPNFSRRGYNMEILSLIGTKTIIPNQSIGEILDNNGVSMKRLYDSLNLEQDNFSYSLMLDIYSPLSKKIGLKTSLSSKGIFSEDIGLNEMYFLGGIKHPRGFDDNVFISPIYFSGSVETQYYFNDYFYYNIFADISCMKSSLDSKINYPIGLGTGFSFQSRSSVLNFSIAYGISEDQNFSFNRSKIHIGYVGLF